MTNIFPGQPILLGQKQVAIDPWARAMLDPTDRVARVVYRDVTRGWNPEPVALLPLPPHEVLQTALIEMSPAKWARTFGHRLLALMLYVRRATGTPVLVPNIAGDDIYPSHLRSFWAHGTRTPRQVVSFGLDIDPLYSVFRVWTDETQGYLEIPLLWLYMDPDDVQLAAVKSRLRRLAPTTLVVPPGAPSTQRARLLARNTLDNILLGLTVPDWPPVDRHQIQQAYNVEYLERAKDPTVWLEHARSLIDQAEESP